MPSLKHLSAAFAFTFLLTAAVEFHGPRDHLVPGTPSAIVTADLRHTGQQDLVVANFGGIAIYCAKSAGAFEPGYSVYRIPTNSVVAGDFNKDGNIDLAAVQLTNGSQIVFLPGNGDGTFGAPSIFRPGINPWMLAAADFNRDGNLDLAVADTEAGVYIMLGDGKGNFSQAGTAGNRRFQPGWRADLILAGLVSLDITVLLNQGGHLAVTPSVFVPGMTVDAATGDFNGDGLDDIAIANNGNGTVSVFLNSGGRNFTRSADLAVPGAATILVRDFNRDGRADLAVGTYTQVFLFFGNGDGAFTTGPVYNLPTYCTINSVSPGPMRCLVAADFNDDGFIDLAGANWVAGTISVLLGNGDGTFRTGATFSSGPNPQALVTADFNGDGSPDLATANFIDGVFIFLNRGDGTFAAPKQTAAGTNPISLAAGDLNGDGIPDLVFGDGTFPLVHVMLGLGGGAFGAPSSMRADLVPLSLAIADFDHDGHLDVATANIQANSLSVFAGNGDGTFQSQRLYDTGGIPSALVTGKLLPAHEADLVIADQRSGFSILLNTVRSMRSARLSRSLPECEGGRRIPEIAAPGRTTHRREWMTIQRGASDEGLLP